MNLTDYAVTINGHQTTLRLNDADAKRYGVSKTPAAKTAETKAKTPVNKARTPRNKAVAPAAKKPANKPVIPADPK